MQASILKGYENLVGALGTRRMAVVLFETVNQILAVDELFCFERQFTDRQHYLISAGEIADMDRTAPAQNRFHSVDPLTAMILRRQGPETLTLKLRVEQIQNADYRFQCYERFQYGERVSLGTRHRSGWYVLNLYRRSGRRTASATTIDRLCELAQLAMPLMTRHAALIQTTPLKQDVPVERISKRLKALFPELAERERAVCAHTMVGSTAKSIGVAFGIASNTVLTYRRRAYQKLGISSAAQLTGDLLG
jgi:ATP/maltotriose-dependent transcriptional regulator MalT